MLTSILSPLSSSPVVRRCHIPVVRCCLVSPRPLSLSYSSIIPLKRTISVRVNCNEPTKETAAAAAFLDENGVVVKDIDGYLNNLSLEYESVWDTKPYWCQPWTIALTGVVSVAVSWLILHSVVVTTLVSSLICAWWYIFLYSYPKAYSDMIAKRRKQVTNGVEDTFGRKPQ